jgi:hypothetical protein
MKLLFLPKNYHNFLKIKNKIKMNEVRDSFSFFERKTPKEKKSQQNQRFVWKFTPQNLIRHSSGNINNNEIIMTKQ